MKEDKHTMFRFIPKVPTAQTNTSNKTEILIPINGTKIPCNKSQLMDTSYQGDKMYGCKAISGDIGSKYD